MPASRNTFSLQIVGSLFLVFGVGLLSLILVGHNAIKMTDEAALARQERFAARKLAAAISDIPEQQRSSSIWDEAIQNAKDREEQWLDENLGAWMQDYFGHNESYILDQSNESFFASIQGKLLPPEIYSTRAGVIAPLVTQLREIMVEVTAREDDPNAALAEVAVVTPLRLGEKVAIVSVVPIISDSGEVVQVAGTEALHVAVRYIDDKLAQEIGLPIELVDVAFEATPSTGALASIPVSGASGDVLTSLVWKPERPGTDLFMNMLPVLLAMALASGALLFLLIRRLLRISRQLHASETQARLDVVAINEAREAAEVADRAKMNFMSIVSHELRTPLTVILGYARLGKNPRQMPPAQQLRDTLQQQPLNASLLKCKVEKLLEASCAGMGKIERSGEHLLFLVNQLLDYAKIETGRLEVTPEICDVREVLEPVVEQMRVLTEQKDLDLETTITPCFVLADVTRTRQILINLMGNAIKFTDTGKISVVVREAENKVCIDVVDTGMGIEPHELEVIFEAFHQADLTSSRSAAGTGLGLSVAKQLAHLEGGTLTVRSEVGVGSTFTLSLPSQTPRALADAA